MEIILKGKISSGVKVASRRLKACQSALNKYGLTFPPLFLGTINIKLEINFPTPNWSNVIHIPARELDEADPIKINGRSFRECWELIPVVKINDNSISGYIYRTTTNYHGDGFIELIAENLSGKINLAEGTEITVVVTEDA